MRFGDVLFDGKQPQRHNGIRIFIAANNVCMLLYGLHILHSTTDNTIALVPILNLSDCLRVHKLDSIRSIIKLQFRTRGTS